MKQKRPDRSVWTTIAIVITSVIFFFLIPWTVFRQDYFGRTSADPTTRGSFSSAPRRSSVSRVKSWSAAPEYKPADGTLTINVSHADRRTFENLNVYARLSAGGTDNPSRPLYMRNEGHGTYRADGLEIKNGTWAVSITGRSPRGFEFWLEKTLTVK